MASHDRQQPPSVIEELFANPERFTFFQAIRLLRHHAQQNSAPDLQRFYRDSLRIRPQLSLGFPVSELTSLERGQKQQQDVFKLETTFLGLYGISSPLPVFYTEELLIERSEDETVTRHFLDLLNNNLYSQYFKAWSRSQLMIRTVEERDSAWLERLYCLIGYGHESMLEKCPVECRQFRHIGLYSQYPRSAMGLETLLRDSLNHLDIHLEQCVMRKVRVPEAQRFSLGLSSNTLGEQSWLGEELDDRAGQFRIHIVNLTAEQYRELLPGRKQQQMVANLVEGYLVEALVYDLVLAMREGEVNISTLGEQHWAELGCDTWLSSGKCIESGSVVFSHCTNQ